MRIKLALLCEDMDYAKRLTAGFNNNYNDKLEIYLFSNCEKNLEILTKNRIDVFLCDTVFDISIYDVPKRCGFAYLVESPDIDTVKGKTAICKYQRLELLYKAILSIYSENVSETFGFRVDTDLTKLIMFTSPAGGVGTSTIAASCAKYLSQNRKRVLFLSLSIFENTRVFFSGDGNSDFSDVLYAIKSRKSNFALKFESMVRNDSSGVYFVQTPDNALDMKEMTDNEMLSLIESIQNVGNYDYLIVDADFDLTERSLELMKKAVSVVMVSNGTEVSNMKFRAALNALQVIDEQRDENFLNKVYVLYNAFSSKSGQIMEEYSSNMLGGVPRYENAKAGQIADIISKLSCFEKLVC